MESKTKKYIFPTLYINSFLKEKQITVSKFHMFNIFHCLKLHINYKYNLLISISGVDLLSNKYRFCVVYELLSLLYNTRIRIKVFISQNDFIYSLTNVYINANWWEREIWDFFGIYFLGHVDMRRILTDYGFEGYPMRKDFPLSGFVEIRYNQNKKRIVIEPVELTQEFRYYSFDKPW
jgi:NADH/F420H2 dehydrogenase subunit C